MILFRFTEAIECSASFVVYMVNNNDKFAGTNINSRGAEIPPPPNLQSSGRPKVLPKIGGVVGGVTSAPIGNQIFSPTVFYYRFLCFELEFGIFRQLSMISDRKSEM